MRRLFRILVGAVLVLVLAGCPGPLISGLPSDLILTLGRFGSASAVANLFSAPGGKLSVPVTISDQTGKDNTGSFDISFVLSTDADIATTGDNVDLSSQNVAAGAEQIVVLDIPAAVVAGAFTLFGVMTATDAVLNNNTASIGVTIGATNQPNLTVAFTSPSTGNVFALPAATVLAGFSVTNDGFAKIDTGTAIDLTFEVTLSAAQVSVGTTTITLSSDLYPQQTIAAQATLTVPGGQAMADDNGETQLTSWTGNITATVDSATAITETNEGDNTDTLTLNSGSQTADLVVQSINTPDDIPYARIGSPVGIAVTLRNRGYAAATGYQVELFVDMDASTDKSTGDIVLYTWDAPGTVPWDVSGTSDELDLAVPEGTVYPDTIAAGAYRIYARIIGSMSEWDTTNNSGNTGLYDFVASAVDLQIDHMSTSLTGPVDEAAGGTIPVTFRLYNQYEDEIATDFDVHFYASPNGGLTPAGDIDLGATTVTGTVPAYGRLVGSADLTFPAAQGADFYTIYWVVDSTTVIAEVDENNNQPTNAEDVFVFVPVSDGAATIQASLVVVKPQMSNPQTTYIEARFYDDAFAGNTSTTSVYTSIVGVSSQRDVDLIGGKTAGLRVRGYNNDDLLSGPAPYAFRFVPRYVDFNGTVPVALLPMATLVEDTFEQNDTTGTSTVLSGSQNPLIYFVSAYTDYASYAYEYDYYSVVIP